MADADLATPESAASSLMEEARQCLLAGKPQAALPLLRRHLASEPRDRKARLALAAALCRTGAPEAAITEFGQLLKDAPEDAGALFGMAHALYGAGDRAGALDAFRRIVISDVLAWKAWGSIADITPEEDERVHAIEGAADALAILCAEAPATPRRLAAAAEAWLDARQPGRAARLLGCAGAAGPGEPGLIRRLARAHYHKGDFAGAFRQALRLLEMAPDRPAPREVPRAFQPAQAVSVLTELQIILAAAGVRSFLTAGTLLGFHRSGGPLAHDRDVDIGILRSPDGSPDIAGILRAHPSILLPRISRPGDRYFGVTCRGIAADIFLYDRSGDHLYCGFSHLPGDIAWRFSSFALTEADYGGQRWTIPAAPERYLSETYGPGWQTPDTSFASAVSSPALWRADPHARAFYAAIRAARALAAGDIPKAESLAAQSPVPFSIPQAAATAADVAPEQG